MSPTSRTPRGKTCSVGCLLTPNSSLESRRSTSAAQLDVRCKWTLTSRASAKSGNLYVELIALLGKHGKQDAHGGGDFWVVDDNYGSPQHKVCVARVSFITRPVALEAQRVIRKYSLPWEILFSLDSPSLRPTPEDMGITVRKAAIEECWSADRMAQAFGENFRWRPHLARC